MRNLVQLWVVGNLNGTVEPAEQLDTFMARRDAEQAEAELAAPKLTKENTMLVGFDKWWQEDGRMLDPDTEDVPWFDKRKELAELAFAKGVEIGMARSRNYTANSAVDPDRIHFANGRIVKLRYDMGRVYLAVLED